MQNHSRSVRCAVAFAAFLFVLLLLACGGRFGPVGPAPRPQNTPMLPPPVVMVSAAELFGMGAEGEAKYRGKVVSIYGKVNVDALGRVPAGGTRGATVESEDGGPPYAIARIDEDSNELLFGPSNEWRPITSVGFHGIYRERDERGTILLESARAMSVTKWAPSILPRPKDLAKKDGMPKDGVAKDGTKKDRTKKDRTKTDGEKKPEPPLLITAEKLTQDLADDAAKGSTKVYFNYRARPLQITGVVHNRAESKGAIVRIDFQAKIKDPRSGKPDEWIVFCGLKTPVQFADKAAADLATGKTVTIRGMLSAGGNGQATLHDCEIVRE